MLYLTPIIAVGFTALTASSSLSASPSLVSGYEEGASSREHDRGSIGYFVKQVDAIQVLDSQVAIHNLKVLRYLLRVLGDRVRRGACGGRVRQV
jgi:hypothetical protein